MNETKNESVLKWNVGDKIKWITNEYGFESVWYGEITEKHNDHLIGVVGELKDITIWIDDVMNCSTNKFVRL